MKAMRIHKQGGPEEMKWEDIPEPAPGKGEVLIRHTAIGLNFIDTYQRSGLYPVQLPAIVGNEAAAVVEKLGEGVSDLKVGDRVAYGSGMGAYAEKRLFAADKLVKIPDGIDDRTVASMMLKGMTTQYLVRRTYAVKKGDTILVHAAAGGVGLILVQWAKHLGATVIGTVGSADKAKLAKAHGCDHVILYRDTDFVAEVKKITSGKGVPVVYDGVGKDTFMPSLDCLSPRGLMASFGNASGAVPPFSILTLSQKGSLYVTRPTLATHIATREDLVATANDLFAVVKSGAVKIEVNQTYALKDAAQAHRDLESRKTTGSTVLIP